MDGEIKVELNECLRIRSVIYDKYNEGGIEDQGQGEIVRANVVGKSKVSLEPRRLSAHLFLVAEGSPSPG